MFWITFFVSGLIVASVPWLASHFSNRIAGYVVLIPIMMLVSFTVQYRAHGTKATIEMIQGTLYGLPTLLVFGLVAIILIKNNLALPLAMTLSLSGWLLSLLAINFILGK
jgi:uncharacterized membrane protein (GlpM family)